MDGLRRTFVRGLADCDDAIRRQDLARVAEGLAKLEALEPGRSVSVLKSAIDLPLLEEKGQGKFISALKNIVVEQRPELLTNSILQLSLRLKS